MAASKKTAMPNVVNTAISLIKVDENARKTFDKASLKELAANIKAHGILEPLIVREVDGKVHLVAGERRLRAAKAAGLKHVPTIKRELTDDQVLEVQLIENLQREDLPPLEEAAAVKKLMERGMSQREIAKLVGKSEGWVSARARFLDLPTKTKNLVKQGRVHVEQAVALLPYKDHPELIENMEQSLKTHVDTFHHITTADLKEQVIDTALDNDSLVMRIESRWQYSDREVRDKFNIKECKKCPKIKKVHYRYGGAETELACFEKDCWSGKLREAKKAVREKRKKQRDKENAEAKEKGLVDVRKKYGYNQVKWFSKRGWDAPKFDTKACLKCEHRVKARQPNYDGSTHACLNPSCWEKKDKAVRDANKKKWRRQAAAIALNLEARSKGAPALTVNEQRLILHYVIGQLRTEPAIKAAFEPYIKKRPKKNWQAAIPKLPDDAVGFVTYRMLVLEEAIDMTRVDDNECKTPLTTYTAALMKIPKEILEEEAAAEKEQKEASEKKRLKNLKKAEKALKEPAVAEDELDDDEDLKAAMEDDDEEE